MTGTAVARVVDTGTGEVLTADFSMASYLTQLSGPAHLAHQQKLAAVYDAACAALIGENDVQKEGGRSFKKKSAWRKLARHFNISTSVQRVERDMVGEHFMALVTVRATAPWGQSADAVGACCTDEATGRRTITVADAIATAETRATNRATSNLIAMGEVTAEEIGERKALPASAQSGDVVPDGTGDPMVVGEPLCPKCDGRMWDNRAGKRNPKAPDYKCRDRACEGVVWPPKEGAAKAAPVRTDSGPLVRDDDFAPLDEPPF